MAVRAAHMPLENGKWDTAYPQSNLTTLVVQTVKNPPANAGDTGDVGSIPELGRSLGHPGSQAESRGEAKDSTLFSSPDRYLLEPTEWSLLCSRALVNLISQEHSGLL